ncbi:MAG TPA: group III truncated hemoglobin [Rhodothermales bacterium]
MMSSDEATIASDIQTETDIQRVVDAFYRDIDRDPVLGTFFAGLDMSNHLPRMYAFWSAIVFQTGTYRGRPFEAHARLAGLAPHHFARWLQRWESTVDSLFTGDRATEMKQRAHHIATVFQVKLGLDEPTST